jgi:WD40 repeat protein
MYAGQYCTPSGASAVNFGPGRAIANMVLAQLAPDGTVTLYNGSAGTVRIIADLSAYVLGPQAPAGALSISNGAMGGSGGVSMSDDGRYVAFGSYLWDSTSRATTMLTRPMSSWTPPYCNYFETPLSEGHGEVSGDGQHVLYFHPPEGDTGSRMHVVSRPDGTSQLITKQPVSSSTISDRGTFVAYAPFEGIIDFWTDPTELIRWNRSTGEHEVIATVPEGQSMGDSRISGDGRTIAYEVGGDQQTAGQTQIFRWRNGQSESIAQGSIHDISDDGNTILMTTTDGLVLWSNGASQVIAPQPDDGVINLARLSGDARVVVWQRQHTADPEGPATVHRQEVGKEAVRIINYGNGSKASALALSGDGARLAYAEWDSPTDYAGGLGVFVR